MMPKANTAVLAAKPTPDPRVAGYIAEIEQPGIPYVSYSHTTLLRLYAAHGKDVVNNLISDYFAEVRIWKEGIK